ncbi:MAG: 23S rRNA (uracil(1939)-C(5))-methyltransferase RlmD [Chloroflexota bacterium]
MQIQVQLLDWGARGATVGQIDDARVLIDRGIPGERVEAIVRPGKQPWLGTVDRVVEPATSRIAPVCPHYAQGCGGCQWQHIDYATQVETKRALVDREMESHGVPARVETCHTMTPPWRYRHTAAIAIGWEAGFRPRGRRGIVEVRDCPISHPLIGRFASDLNDLLRAGRLPNYHGKAWLECTVVGTETAPSLQVMLQSIAGITTESHPELQDVADVVAGLPSVCSVAYRHRSGEPKTLVGPLESTIEVDGKPFLLPAGSFFQTNLRMVPRVLGHMRERVAHAQLRSGADIYGGVGTLGLPLAPLLDSMTLVELDPFAVNAARGTARAWGLQNVDFLSMPAERALPSLPPLDVAIVDPPRSGLGEKVIAAIALKEVPLVLYLSCSPASLAADLAGMMSFGYRVESLDMYDFYPHTYHVECLAIVRA